MKTKYLLQKKYIRKTYQNNKKMTLIVRFFTLSQAGQFMRWSIIIQNAAEVCDTGHWIKFFLYIVADYNSCKVRADNIFMRGLVSTYMNM